MKKFKKSSQESLGQFQPNLAQFGEGDANEGDNNEIAKIHSRTSKIFFSRTLGPIFTKLSTMHRCVMGI